MYRIKGKDCCAILSHAPCLPSPPSRRCPLLFVLPRRFCLVAIPPCYFLYFSAAGFIQLVLNHVSSFVAAAPCLAFFSWTCVPVFFCFYGNFWCFVLTCLWTCGGSPRNIRRAIAQLEEEGTNAYPHKFHASISIPDFVAKFQDVEVGEKQASGRRNRKAAPDPCRLAT